MDKHITDLGINMITKDYHKNMTVLLHNSPYENAIGGHLHRNFIFRILKTQIPEEWCYMLDDDNLIHHKLIDFFVNNEFLDKATWAFFSMVRNDGSVMEADTNNIKVGHVDTSMVLFKAKVLNGFIFENDYTADGKFIGYLNQTRRTEMYYWPVVMAYYNKLRGGNAA